MKTHKGDLVLTANEKQLTNTAKQLAKQIKELNKSDESKDVADRLTQVHSQIVNLIREEFRTLRTRNNRISTIQE